MLNSALQEILAKPWAFWVILGLIAGLFELLLPSFSFIFASFAATFAAFVALKFGWIAQLSVFMGALALAILILRPRLVERFHAVTKIPSRAQALFGLSGLVTESIDPMVNTGRVFVEGQDWAARSESEQPIAAGQSVTVESSDGIVLIVKSRDSLKES